MSEIIIITVKFSHYLWTDNMVCGLSIHGISFTETYTIYTPGERQATFFSSNASSQNTIL